MSEKKLLRNVKYGTLILLAVFFVQGFTRLPEVWPLSRWRMYAGPRVLEPQVTLVGVTIIGTDHETHTLYLPDLGSYANQIVRGAFGAHGQAYRPALLQRIQSALPHVEISRVTGWQFTYEVNYLTIPLFQYEQPIQAVELGSFTIDAQ